MSDLRTRIVSAIEEGLASESASASGYGSEYFSEEGDGIYKLDGTFNIFALADAVIRELDDVLVDFGLWLSEEITGKPISRIDLESCHQEWKWLNDESRWIKGGTDAD